MRVPDYNRIFPFYSRSRFIRITESSDVMMEDILFPDWFHVDKKKAQQLLEGAPRYSKYWNFIRVLPTNILIPVVESSMDYQILWAKAHWEELEMPRPRISGKIRHAHYPSVVSLVTVEESAKGMFKNVYMNDGSLEISELAVEDIESVLAIIANETYSDMREIIDLWPEFDGANQVVVKEAKAINLKKKPAQRNKIKMVFPDVIENYLKDYVLNRGHTQRVPLLVGNTAVAKSAIVKSVAKELDYRLIDVRCAFMDKLDIEGLVKRKITPDGKVFSYNAPMDKIMEATDDFIKYSKAMVEKIEAYIESNPDMGTDERSALDETLAKFRDKSRPCILFFDEITRAPTSVRNAFTTILNQKKFQDKTMHNCRIVTATNVPVELPEDLKDIYLTDAITDIASLDRFETVQVTPAMIFDRWKRMATSSNTSEGHPREGMTNFHEAVTEFIGEDVDRAYNFDVVLESLGYNKAEPGGGANFDEEQVSVTPFPNYRTWEYVSDHLYAVQLGHVTFNEKIITGFIGVNKVSEDFFQFMKLNYEDLTQNNNGNATLSGISKSDEMLSGIEECIDSGVPSLLLGMSSFGKTTRLFELEKKRKNSSRPILVVPIILGLKDRTDIMGAPTSVSAHSSMSEGLKKLGVDASGNPTHPIFQEMSDLHTYNLPDHMTSMAPNISLKNTIEKGIKEGKLVVLFFDELNRAHPTVMSSVFEAISDQRFMGITWKPGQVAVVAAANYGPHHPDAQAFDPAFAARFSIFRKDAILPEDTENIIAFMENKNGEFREGPPFDPIITEFIREMTPEERVIMFTEIEQRTIESSASSLRSFSDLDAAIGRIKRPVLQGALASDEVIGNLTVPWGGNKIGVRDLESYLDSIENDLKKLPANWAGLNSDYIVDLGDEERGMKDFHEGVLASIKDTRKEIADKTLTDDEARMVMATLESLMPFYMAANDYVSAERRHIFEAILGSEPNDSLGGESRGQQFLGVFNAKRGYATLTIEDLVTEALIDEWLVQKVDTGPDMDSFVNWSVETLTEFVKVHDSDWKPGLGGYFLLRFMETAAAPEWSVRLVLSSESSPEVNRCLHELDTEDLIRKAHSVIGEPNPDDYVEEWFASQKKATV